MFRSAAAATLLISNSPTHLNKIERCSDVIFKVVTQVTLVTSDAGKVVHVHTTTTTVVVPNSVFSVGNVVTILNVSSSNITINQDLDLL